jgi:hypothetical protein
MNLSPDTTHTGLTTAFHSPATVTTTSPYIGRRCRDRQHYPSIGRQGFHFIHVS